MHNNKLLLLLFLFLAATPQQLLNAGCPSQTCATNGDAAAINSAIGIAADGDTITVPPNATFRWTTGVIIPATKAVTLKGGPGTVIYNGVTTGNLLQVNARTGVPPSTRGATTRVTGFDFEAYDGLSSWTGTVNHPGGYPLTNPVTTTITVAGLPKAVDNGDTFKVTGEVVPAGTPQHKISAHTETGGVTTSVTFSPGLSATVADSTALNFTRGKSISDQFLWTGTDQRTDGRVRFDTCTLGEVGQLMTMQSVTGVFNNLTCHGLHMHPWDQNWRDDIYGYSLFSDGSFAAPITWGSQDWLYIEHCTFIGASPNGGITDSYYGGRFVFRYNTCTGAGILNNHGTETGGGRGRGVLAIDSYGNSFDGAYLPGAPNYPGQASGQVMEWRGGTFRVHDNTFPHFGPPFNITGHTYRFYTYNAFGPADGTNPVDVNDTTGGAGTNGIHYSGQAVSAVSGGANVVTVTPDPSWSPANKWKGYVIRKTTNRNVPTTAVHPQNSCMITGSTGNTLTFQHGFSSSASNGWVNDLTFQANDGLEIRRVIHALDQCSRTGGNLTGGATTPAFPATNTPPNSNNQVTNPSYEWNNTPDTPFTNGGQDQSLVEGVHYFNNTAPTHIAGLPDYAMLTDPHPLSIDGPNVAPSQAKFITGTTVNCATGTNCLNIVSSGFSSPAPSISVISVSAPPGAPAGQMPANVALFDATPVAGTAQLRGTAATAVAGDYHLLLYAANATQNVTQAFTLTVAAANGAPSTQVTTPANGSTWQTIDNVTVTATASDPDGNATLTEIKLLDGPTVLKTCTAAGVTTCSDTRTYSIGSHSFSSKATDNAGNVTTSPQVVNISVGSVSTTPTPPAQLILTPAP